MARNDTACAPLTDAEFVPLTEVERAQLGHITCMCGRCPEKIEIARLQKEIARLKAQTK